MSDDYITQNTGAATAIDDPNINGNNKLILRITYDGNAVKDHEINAVLFSTSVLGLIKAIESTHHCLNSQKPNITFKIRNIEGNCVSTDVVIYIQNIATVLKYSETTNLITNLIALGLITTSAVKRTYGLIQFLIKMYKKYKQNGKTHNNKNIMQVISDEDKKLLSEESKRLISDEQVRVGISQFYEGLSENGVSSISTQIKSDKNSSVKIDYKEKVALLYGGKVDTTKMQHSMITAEFISLNFNGRSGWKIKRKSDGKTLPVKIDDFNFMEKVRNREINFKSGDIYHMCLNTEETITDTEIKFKYSISDIISLMENQSNLFDIKDLNNLQ